MWCVCDIDTDSPDAHIMHTTAVNINIVPAGLYLQSRSIFFFLCLQLRSIFFFFTVVLVGTTSFHLRLDKTTLLHPSLSVVTHKTTNGSSDTVMHTQNDASLVEKAASSVK